MKINVEVQDGDVLVTQTNIPGVQHFGVIILDGQGVDVLHIRPFENVTRESVKTFLADRRFLQLRRTGASREYILNKFQALQRTEYDVTTFNCIDFAEILTNTDY